MPGHRPEQGAHRRRLRGADPGLGRAPGRDVRRRPPGPAAAAAHGAVRRRRTFLFEGTAVGAIGISGASEQQDEQCAQAAVRAVLALLDAPSA
ncbi:heme-binding protein [Azotobacter chroococcum]